MKAVTSIAQENNLKGVAFEISARLTALRTAGRNVAKAILKQTTDLCNFIERQNRGCADLETRMKHARERYRNDRYYALFGRMW